jgi:hypothetical protein
MQDTSGLLRLLLRSLGCLVQVCSEPIQRTFPEFSILFDPLRRLLERFRVQLHFMHAPVTAAPQQTGVFENAEMFGNGGQRHRVRPGELGNAPVPLCQVRQNLPARGISQGGKSSVQRSRRIFNHLVNCLAQPLQPASIFFVTIFGSRRTDASDSPDQNLQHRLDQDRRINYDFPFHFDVKAFVSNVLPCRRLAEAPLQHSL